eukprot:6646106-Alexandrium_andersonii.AAC.1
MPRHHSRPGCRQGHAEDPPADGRGPSRSTRWPCGRRRLPGTARGLRAHAEANPTRAGERRPQLPNGRVLLRPAIQHWPRRASDSNHKRKEAGDDREWCCWARSVAG